MNEVFPRCAVPGSSCRLLQLEAPGARPVWAVLDAAGARHFTGEITLHCVPTVRAWFNGGELYFAERDGDPGLADRLLAMGVLSADDLSAGSVQLGAVTHLGRLFDRVPRLDRDHVELALEILTGEVVGEIADHVVEEITIASYRHHPSGVVKWQKRPTVVITQVAGEIDPAATASVVAAPVVAPRHEHVPTAEHIDLVPTAEDEALVAEYEASLALPEPQTGPVETAELPGPADDTDTPVDDQDLRQDLRQDLAPDHDDTTHVEDVQEPDHQEPQQHTDVEEPATAATREQPVFDELLLDPEPAAADDVVEPDVEPDVEPQIEAEFDRSVEAQVEAQVEAPIEVLVEARIDAPVEAEDPLAAFERSLNAQLDATFDQHFAQHFDQHLDQHLTAGADTPLMPVLEPVLDLPVLDSPVLDSPVLDSPVLDSPADVDPDDQPVPSGSAADAPVLTEQTWAIDDRVDWHVDTPAPTAPAASAPTPPAAPASADGPVVEFDLQHLLQQDDTDRGSGTMTVAGVEVPEETDADIRAAVQAALAEIAAATRPGGDHEVPSILMQAALVADAETGLTPSPDLWDVAAPAASTPPPPPPAAARPIVPILPDRAPSAAPLPSMPQASDTPTVAGTDPTAPDGSVSSEPPRTEEPVAPPTGGLRRLMGSRKP